MKLIYLHIEKDYKNIKSGTYKFDNEFNVEFDYENKTIKINENPKYYKQFDGSIENISCIVGKNGMGKTTFIEILISLKLWRLDGERNVGEIHALFYDGDTKTFFIQTYISKLKYWKIDMHEIGYQFKQFNYTKNASSSSVNDIGYAGSKSILPTPISFIFHSLSPFDRIYDLIKDIYLTTSGRARHYGNFGYMGVNKIKDDEPSYNFLTIKNLLHYSHISKEFKDMLKVIGYKFGNLSIELGESYFQKEINLVDFDDINLDKLDIDKFTKDDFEKIKELILEVNLTPRINYNQWSEFLSDDFVGYMLFLNLDLSKFNNFKRFLKLCKEKYADDNILEAVKKLLKNISSIDIEKTKHIFYKNSHSFLARFQQDKEIFRKSYDLLLNLNEYFNSPNFNTSDLYKALEHMMFFQNKDIIDFKINLIKNETEIDFLRLSSGEKTLLSYIFNIYDKIINLQNKTDTTIYKKTSIVLIDEVKLHLHPEWQREFVHNINKFLLD